MSARGLLLGLVTFASAAMANPNYGWYTGTDGYYHCYTNDSAAGAPPVDPDYCCDGQYGWYTGTDGAYHCYPMGSPAGTLPVDDGKCGSSLQ